MAIADSPPVDQQETAEHRRKNRETADRLDQQLAERHAAEDLGAKDLATLEREIKMRQMTADMHGTLAVAAALEIGERLAAARQLCQNQAEFVAWAEDRFKYKKSHSYRLVRLAASVPRVKQLVEQDPTLSLRGALAAIADKLKEEATAPPREHLEVSATLPWHVDVRELDAAAPPAEWESSLDLVVTSWPYGIGEQRCGYIDVPTFTEWKDRAWEWASALLTVLKPRGRVCLVLPVTTRKGGPRPLAAWGHLALEEAGLVYETTIEWPKSEAGQTSNGVPRGSVESPNAPCVLTGAEQILVYHRGEWNLGRPGEPSDLEHQEWLDWTNGLWVFGGARDPRGYPCVFPEELARRCIKAFSFPGDVVGDLHCGSGTTAGVAVQLGRGFKGGDLNPDAVQRTMARAAAGSKERK